MANTRMRRCAVGWMLLFAVAYMVSYLTRIQYGAIITEMEADTGLSKSLLSMALTGSFITYGAGQLVSGFLGDRISPKKLLAVGLGFTTLMNLALPLWQNPWYMLVIWCINGFAQSFMWPPLVGLMARLFTSEEYKTASVVVSAGSSVGTILIYLTAPLLISLWGWRAVFVATAIAGLLFLVVWVRLCPGNERTGEDVGEVCPKSAGKSSSAGVLCPLILCIMTAIVLQGMLRDGVTTWMPSFIAESYGMSNVLSIFTSAILPVFSVLCFWLAKKLYTTVFENPMVCAGVLFGSGAVAALILVLLRNVGVFPSAASMAVLTGCMHGVNLMLISMVPPYFKSTGNVSSVSGLLNSCTYVGSAISTYGIALLSERFGWGVTSMVWLAIALAGTGLCFAAVPGWKKKFSK